MTPARYAREMATIQAINDKLQQEKFVEFKMACESGEPGGCNGLGEWYAVRVRLTFRLGAARAITGTGCDKHTHVMSQCPSTSS